MRARLQGHSQPDRYNPLTEEHARTAAFLREPSRSARDDGAHTCEYFDTRFGELDARFRELVTREYLREYLGTRLADFVTRDYLDTRLRRELQNNKRDLLAWVVAMLAPLYALVIVLAFRLGL